MSATRRDFLRVGSLAGAGLVLEIPLLGAPAARKGAAGLPFAPSPWLRVARDGSVTLVVARSEMGQGVRTSLAMILAEELEADWSKIAIEQASPSPAFEDMSTGGSDSVIAGWMPLRRAGAAAREMLVDAAARTWKAGRADCRAEKGFVVHAPSGRRLSYGELVPVAAKLPVPKDPPLKDPRAFRIVGTRVPRVDGAAIVSGSAGYGLDARVPGMLFAAVARSPVAGGRVARFDGTMAAKMRGVRGVFPISTGVAVVADNTWTALSARDALEVQWDAGKNAGLTTAELSRRLDEAAGRPGRSSRIVGDSAAALGAAPTRLTATYRDAFQAHATVEPMNAAARVRGGRCEIWAPTQNPQRCSGKRRRSSASLPTACACT